MTEHLVRTKPRYPRTETFLGSEFCAHLMGIFTTKLGYLLWEGGSSGMLGS